MDRIASITFDMDDLEDIVQGYGVNEHVRPVVYERAVPRMLEILNDVGLKATFFVVGKGVEDRSSKRLLRTIADAGHEIGSHSFSHRFLLDLTFEETREDIVRNSRLLSDIVGRKIVGYRSPALTLNGYLMEILIEEGYEYDSSVNPTFLFVGEWFYLFLSTPSKRNMPRLFHLKHGWAKSRPYHISPTSFFRSRSRGDMVELPISHVPFFNVPFYATFHFMFPFMYPLSKNIYFKNRQVVYHAHALDFLDMERDNIPSTSCTCRHPGVAKPWHEKRSYFHKVFDKINEKYSEVVTAEVMARRFRQMSEVKERSSCTS